MECRLKEESSKAENRKKKNEKKIVWLHCINIPLNAAGTKEKPKRD